MSPRVGENVGYFTGLGLGGLLGGYHSARFFPHLIKSVHGGVYGVANALTCVAIDQVARCIFKGQDYDHWPLWKKSLLVLPLSTVLTGCVANFLGVPILFSMALKITAAAIIFGFLGSAIGKGSDTRRQVSVQVPVGPLPHQAEGDPSSTSEKVASAPPAALQSTDGSPLQPDAQPGETLV
jgi:hypothetical protein